MKKILDWLKEFKPHAVQFEDGSYGIRERVSNSIGYQFYDVTGYAWQWRNSYTTLNKEQVISTLNRLKNKKMFLGVPIELS